MARTEARIFTRIWQDEDFTDLPMEAQWLWFHILSQADLSYCGVLPYTPQRWAAFAHLPPSKMTQAAMLLVQKEMLVVDEKTSEVWIRTLVRNDGITNHPSLIRSMARDFTAILSPRIRDEFVEGLGEGFLEGIAARFPGAFGPESRDGLPAPLVDAYDERSTYVRAPDSPIPYPHSPPNPRRPPRRANDPDFDRWWNAYPRKVAKGDARRAWVKALGRVDGDVERLIVGAERYRDDPNREAQYTAHPATWLNHDRWDDEPLPARNGSKPLVNEPDNLGEPFPAWGVKP